MNCKKCNTVIPAGSNTCPNCGETVNSSIIIPTVDRPQIMPDGGIKNNSIPEMEPLIKHEDTNKVNEPKKENNKFSIIYIGIGLFILAVILFIVFGFIVPNSNTDEPVSEDDQEEVLETIIGDEEVGYLALPGDWEYYENEYDTALQYQKGEWIVTLEAFEKLNETETSESLAKTLYTEISGDTEIMEEVEMSTIKILDYDAYKVFWHNTEEDLWYARWYFEIDDEDDDSIYYIGIDGPEEESSYFEIPDTFSFVEIE